MRSPLGWAGWVTTLRTRHCRALRGCETRDLLTKAVARVLFASLMDLIRQYAESGVACPST